MIHINLLPFRSARKQENVRRQVVIFVGSLFVIVLALVWGQTILSGQVATLREEKVSAERELAHFKQIAQQVDELRTHIEMVQQRLNVITVLQEDRAKPVLLLDEMTALVIPKRMWLTNLEDGATSINLKGMAVDNQTIASFLKNLEDSGRFSSVDLVSIVRPAGGGPFSQFKEFEIICRKPAA
ncbi:MAG: PilN domain-containing protein [Desulfatibacillaceae bacterium]|nr:PilN domain-containing protein [Desulfatibacillaceae bacterium]